MKISLDNCHGKLDQYYQLMDKTPIYAAATVLNPAQKWKFFELHWKNQRQKKWLAAAKKYVKRFWEDVYLAAASEARETEPQSDDNHCPEPSNLEQFLHPPNFYTQYQTAAARDEYQEYIKAPPLPCDNPLKWWEARRKEFPILSQMALDVLSIPLISAECERVFSAAKIFISDRRSSLKEEVIEACSLLRHWLKDAGEI